MLVTFGYYQAGYIQSGLATVLKQVVTKKLEVLEQES